MKHKSYSAISFLLTGALIFSGCSAAGTAAETQTDTSAAASQTAEPQAAADTASETAAVETTGVSYFSDRDLSAEVDTSDAVTVTLNGDSISAGSASVSISGSTATITEGGTYLLSGTLNDGSIIVDVDEEEKVQLVLNGVSITSKDFAAIYAAQADKVFITLMDGTTNTLANGGSFTQTDDSNVDAVIFSKDDLTLNGTGTLKITSPAGHGIVGKDDVTITNGTYEITASDTAVRANDSIAVADGTFKLTADSDGLHAENNDDDTLGSIYIADGTFEINVGDDGIHATSSLEIDGGTFDITAAEGLEATYITVNDGTISISASDDGINAARKSSAYSTPTIEINGGTITVVMGAGDTDGLDANGDIIINGGTVDVTGSSTFDYDGTGVINGGTVISNGEKITTMPSQMMGGHGGMNGGMGNGMKGGTNGSMNGGTADGTNGGMNGGMGGRGQHGGYGQDGVSGATAKVPSDSAASSSPSASSSSSASSASV